MDKGMMSPKEKAEELVQRFIPHTRVFHEVLGWEDYIDSAKQCALIAVEELIEDQTGMQQFLFAEIGYLISTPEYWQEVKQEIEKL